MSPCGDAKLNLLTLVHVGGDRYKLTAQLDDGERARIESGEEAEIRIHDVGTCQIAAIRDLPRQEWMLPGENIFVLDVQTVAPQAMGDTGGPTATG
jgi:hypothetical protein